MELEAVKKVLAKFKESSPQEYRDLIKNEYGKLLINETKLGHEEFAELLKYSMHKAQNRITSKPELKNALKKIPNLLIENRNHLIIR